MQQFNAVVELNGWDESVAALQMEICLEGRAHKLALELEKGDRRNFGKLVSHLQKRLRTQYLVGDSVATFDRRSRKHNESAQLIKGFGDKEVSVALAVCKDNTTLWDMINKANEVSEIMKSTKYEFIRKPVIAAIERKKHN